MSYRTRFLAAAAMGSLLVPAMNAKETPKPATGLGAPPPADAVILYNGQGTSAWDHDWKVEKGAMIAGGGSITSKQEFADALVHVEFRPPVMPEAKGQAKGNSGVFLQNRYEVQVLDSNGIADPGRGDCGAIYNVSAPLVNATKPAGEWQAYDIIFRAPRFGAGGKKTEDARITVLQNGIVVQNNVAVPYPTATGEGSPESATGPLMLQDHGNAVAYRNVWVLPLPASGADHY